MCLAAQLDAIKLNDSSGEDGVTGVLYVMGASDFNIVPDVESAKFPAVVSLFPAVCCCGDFRREDEDRLL